MGIKTILTVANLIVALLLLVMIIYDKFAITEKRLIKKAREKGNTLNEIKVVNGAFEYELKKIYGANYKQEFNKLVVTAMKNGYPFDIFVSEMD